MAASGPIEEFRLALSYLEAARSELENWDRLRASRGLDRTSYDIVHARYAQHEKDARELVARLRREAEQQSGPLEDELRSQRRAQKKLIGRVAAGNVNARKANEENRALSVRIAELEARVGDLQSIVSAPSTAEIGGPILVPLDEFPARLGPQAQFKSVKRRMTPMEKNIAAGVAMLVVVVGAVVALSVLRTVIRTQFSVSEIDPSTGFVRIECRNLGNRAISLYAPWPNGRPQAPRGAPAPNRSFGVLIHVKESETTDFRLLEASEGIWKYRGAFVNGEVIEIAPRSNAALYLDLKKLKELGPPVKSIRVEVSRNGGAVEEQREIIVEE